jgi:Helix-turn-helix of DDE superfamily endonuclease
MRYTEIENFNKSTFKRLTGVKRRTFEAMILVIDAYKASLRKHENKGRPSKLSTADQLLIMLMYFREYRTFFHIGVCYSISEMHTWRIVNSTEKILLESKIFHLAGKKALYSAEKKINSIVIDVSEHPVERPKKKQKKTIRGRRSGILKKAKL